MYKYISMEILKTRHARIQWIVIVLGVVTALYSLIFLGTPMITPELLFGSAQNNFSTIWIFTVSFAVAYERIKQEKDAGNYLNIRAATQNNIFNYVNGLSVSMYYLFFKALVAYEIISYLIMNSSFNMFSLDAGFIKLIVTSIVLIILYAVWLLPLIYGLIRFLGVLFAAVMSILFAVIAVLLPPLYSPWSLFAASIANVFSMSRNGLPVKETNPELLGYCFVVGILLILLYELILKFIAKGNQDD
ncbi:hypothetical protein [Weissella confusa]|uniref:hypothetical protein n=1 Tax=Weissella confusa TaxID=1583 RepID=UPI0022DFE61A|nr:hypothetical protein [Weissella confusa]